MKLNGLVPCGIPAPPSFSPAGRGPPPGAWESHEDVVQAADAGAGDPQNLPLCPCRQCLQPLPEIITCPKLPSRPASEGFGMGFVTPLVSHSVPLEGESCA